MDDNQAVWAERFGVMIDGLNGEVARLKTDIAERDRQLEHITHELVNAREAMAELRADNLREFWAGSQTKNADVRDAQRYRFIKANSVAAKDRRDDGTFRFTFSSCGVALVGLTFDAAVDRAIKAEKAEGGRGE